MLPCAEAWSPRSVAMPDSGCTLVAGAVCPIDLQSAICIDVVQHVNVPRLTVESRGQQKQSLS